MYSLLQFILCKDLGASWLQITILITVKPVVSVFSSYWSAFLNERSDRLKSNVIFASIIGVLPTFLFPFFQNIWFLIFAFALYFFTERAVIPAWMEILNKGLTSKQRSRTVANGSLVTFAAASIVPVLFAPWMDANGAIWIWLFPVLGALSLLRVILQLFVVVEGKNEGHSNSERFGMLKFISYPWKNSWKILKTRRDFTYYQIIFFFGGLGLMIMQPALPRFVDEILKLSYTELAIAFALCKGLGFALTNPFWSDRFHKANIYLFCSLVTLAAACSIVLIIFSSYYSICIYLAFLCYGAMQAGSQLSWQLGGTMFPNSEDSVPFTEVNVVLVGVRGCIGPLIGGFVCAQTGLIAPFILGALFCLFGCCFGIAVRKRVKADPSMRAIL